ncbi:protein SIEVE ELEMENT OCCLUSION B-like [Chenopodium quinoa]|uniref:Protein SIEVE ELEMENT OCCLUSION B-like n=1 Tax=Chenopodium quinoa TaxID=63459 RepID=A0A803MUK6_CHEQI|nr:protein SIEVE ELEMENT OCCLUSION B-like [Chenopodium quinoa]
MAYAPVQMTPVPFDSSKTLLSQGSERGGIFLTSDDYALSKQIEQLHNPDARNFDVRPLFYLVEEIISRVDDTQVTGSRPLTEAKGSRVTYESHDDVHSEIPDLPLLVDWISSEMNRNHPDQHETTLSVLHILQHLSWEAKVVITLAAVAVTVGRIWLVIKNTLTNELAYSISKLRTNDVVARNLFEATNHLTRVIQDTTRCIIEFGEIPAVYITDEDPEVKAAMSQIPIAVYWIIRSAVAVARQITRFSTMINEGVGISKANSSEVYKLKTISDHYRKTLTNLYRLIDEKEHINSYNMTKEIMNDKMHIDNMKILRTLIYADDDMPPLYDGPAKKRVPLEILRRKNVLLLISGLDITHEELSILEQSYIESKVHEYEVVWIPIIDSSLQWTDPMKVKLENLKDSMPWYSVHNPSLIRNAVIRFLTDDWNFHGKPMLVVLDPQGKVLSPNAIHMMWIWKNQAFPFTHAREEALWEQETWKLELLVNGIDQKILDWIREEKYILLYGADDLTWIRQFTNEARAVARTLQIPLEMVYVGRSHTKEEVHKICASIIMEQLSHCWQDPTFVWYFWTRIESMIYSKIQLGNVHDHEDTIWQEIQKLHSHDKSHSGWVVLAKGSRIIVHGQGKVAMVTLEELEKWKEPAIRNGFDVGFGNHYTKLHMEEYPCHRILFPSGMRIPRSMPCPDCRRPMHKNESFICCHEDHNAEVAEVLAALTDVDQYEA